MKIAFNWLKEFIDLPESAEEVGKVLTQTGLEVESIERTERIKGGLNGLVIGEVKDCVPHPNADKLKLTKVDVGGAEPLAIVCGAPNVASGQKVIVALVNTTVYPTSGEPFTIKRAKIRGEESEGMICAEDEIGLGTSHAGVMVLNTDLPNGTPATALIDAGADDVFEIGLTPNRGDAASHLGVARDLRAFFRRPLKSRSTKVNPPKIDRPIEVVVENPVACPRYSGVTIRGVKVAPSPDWLQARIQSVGLSPINNIVDITNYVMLSLGQPLHAFDADVVGKKISVKTLPTGTKFITLDQTERTLHDQDLMICNEQGGMCIAGVFGGIQSGVKDTTTSIFLESAHFSADSVRATAMRHGLSTDASFRFERGTDPEMTIPAIRMATSLILELAGGYQASSEVDVYPSPIEPKKIKTTFFNFHRLIGEKIPPTTIREILNHLDILTEDLQGDTFTAVVPAYRSEVTREADLVEEVLRIYGFNNISLSETLSAGSMASFKEKEPHKLQEKVSLFLNGMGFSEIITNSLTNPDYYAKFPVGEAPVEILNKSSEELGIMRTTPVYTGLETVRHNLNRRQRNLRLFEFSKVYQYKEKYKEIEYLTLYLTGDVHEESWLAPSAPTAFHQLMQRVESVLGMLRIKGFEVAEVQEAHYEYGVTLELNTKVIGKIGLLKSKILKGFEINQDVFYAELDWKSLIKAAKTEVQFEPISKYPEVRRDLSLVLEDRISFREIRRIAFKSERKLLNRINVFSVYKGANLGEGKKSYALSFYLQDKERTLNDKQIDKVMNTLIAAFESETGALIRK